MDYGPSGELVTTSKAIVTGTPNTGGVAPAVGANWWGFLREPFSGAWQKGIVPDQPANLVAFTAVYTAITTITDDISKLLPELKFRKGNIWADADDKKPYAQTLIQPNRYQNAIQFLQQWIASKLTHGNAYMLKDRTDLRGIVTDLYVLNPYYVTPLIAADGSVWYQIAANWLAGVKDSITVPASEIIHDRCTCIWHPLIGVSPIYACGSSATLGLRIQANGAKFFENMSRPSGQLTSNGTISEVTAQRLKREFEENYKAGNIGRMFVGGDGLKYEAISLSAEAAQLIDQLRFTVEDIARGFKIPMYKLGGPIPAGLNVSQLNQEYYSQTLQNPIECVERLWSTGIELPPGYAVKLKLEDLMKMDPQARSEVVKTLISCAALTPNEARAQENRPPLEGGDTAYMQIQNYSIAALARRDNTSTPAPKAPGAPSDGGDGTGSQGDGTDGGSGAGKTYEGEFTVEEVARFEDQLRQTPLLTEKT